MATVSGVDRFSPYPDVAHRREVSCRARLRYKRLIALRCLVRQSAENELLNCTGDCMESIYQRFSQSFPVTQFRLHTLDATEEAMQEVQKARSWLLQFVTLHDSLVDKQHIMCLLASGLLKGNREKTDLEILYLALTEGDLLSLKQRLDMAFAMVIHMNYAEKHKEALQKLKDRERLTLPSVSFQLEVHRRICYKIEHTKVDTFACAIPLSVIVLSVDTQDRFCPICRNSYLDFASFSMDDLIADYPVKIKYCGHVIGKSCLEHWLDTPLPDPAKYPHHMCPLCRTDIEGREPPSVPQDLVFHILEHQSILRLMDENGLEHEDCVAGILRLVSEEIAVTELKKASETAGGTSGEKDANDRRQMIMRRTQELRDEKRSWGFVGRQKAWESIRKEWVEVMQKRRSRWND